jgi:hypothetical protein
MASRIKSLVIVASAAIAWGLTPQAWAAGVNFAGDTANAAAAVAMNGQSTHVSNFGQANAILASAKPRVPPVDYKPQVFQREYSKLRGFNLQAKRNQDVLKRIAEMYIATYEFNKKNNRELKIDVLTVEAAGGAKGFARSKAYATQIFETLKKYGVPNISLDPEPRELISLPPGLTGQPPASRT